MITSFEIISRERQSRCVSVSVFSVVLRSTCITSVNLMPSSCSHWPRDTIDMLLHNSPSWIHDLSRIHLPKTRRHIVHDDFCFGFVVWFVWEVHWSNKEEEVKKKVEAWRGTDMAREEDMHNVTSPFSIHSHNLIFRTTIYLLLHVDVHSFDHRPYISLFSIAAGNTLFDA